MLCMFYHNFLKFLNIFKKKMKKDKEIYLVY